MKLPRIFIVEDDAHVIDHLALVLEQNGYELAGSTLSGEEALSQIPLLRPDAAIVDISLEKGRGVLDGIETVARLQSQMTLPVIFLTAFKDMHLARRIAKVEYEGFLNKPPTDLELIAALEKIQARKEHAPPATSHQDDFLLIRQHNGQYLRVPTADILFVETVQGYLVIHTDGGQQYSLTSNLNKFEREHPHPKFLRVSRSSLVNVDHVTGFEDPATLFVAHSALKIGRTYRKVVKQRLPFLRSD